MQMQNYIEDKINQELNPYYLEVLNESYMHSVPPGSQTHFKVIVVSETFDGMRLLARHRLINSSLKQYLGCEIHALALHTYTISEWQNLYGGAPNSPLCRGGMVSV